MVMFFFLANFFFDPVQVIGNQYNQALAAMAGAERYFRLIDFEPGWQTHPRPGHCPRIRGRVEFRNVHFRLRAGPPGFERPVLYRRARPNGCVGRAHRQREDHSRRAAAKILSPHQRNASGSMGRICSRPPAILSTARWEASSKTTFFSPAPCWKTSGLPAQHRRRSPRHAPGAGLRGPAGGPAARAANRRRKKRRALAGAAPVDLFCPGAAGRSANRRAGRSYERDRHGHGNPFAEGLGNTAAGGPPSWWHIG